jgi:hypothetical protein
MVQFRASVITSDGGLLAYRELDGVLALTEAGGKILADARTGKNGQLVGLLRQSVFGRLAGYEDVNDAERLCRDPAMRWVVGGRAPMGQAASASQMGRFETGWLTRPEAAEPLSLTSLREKLIKIGAKVVSHGRYVSFQMAEVAVPRQMFRDILRLIAQLRAPPAPA